LLAQVDQGLDPVHEREDEVHPRFQGLAVPAEPLDVPGPGLRDDPDGLADREQDEDDGDQGGNEPGYFHVYSRGCTSAVAPSIAKTSTVEPTGMTWDSSYGRADHSSPPMRTCPPSSV